MESPRKDDFLSYVDMLVLEGRVSRLAFMLQICRVALVETQFREKQRRTDDQDKTDGQE